MLGHLDGMTLGNHMTGDGYKKHNKTQGAN
jgi:hypothetical protein